MNSHADKLPPLPECDSYCTFKDSHDYDVWNEAQMRAYAVEAVSAATKDLLTALIEERRMRLIGQQPDVHWESLRDMRRAASAATDAAIARATPPQSPSASGNVGEEK